MPPVNWWLQYAKSNRIATYFYYQKQTYLNRAEVKGPHRIERITLPVLRRDTKQSFMDVEVIYGNEEKRRLLQTLRCAYGKTAYFIYYFDELSDILNGQYTNLHNLNHTLVSWMASNFKLPQPEYTKSNFDEIRPWFDKIHWPIHKEYYQPFGNFVPNLSGIDLLMNCGPDAKHILNESNWIK